MNAELRARVLRLLEAYHSQLAPTVAIATSDRIVREHMSELAAVMAELREPTDTWNIGPYIASGTVKTDLFSAAPPEALLDCKHPAAGCSWTDRGIECKVCGQNSSGWFVR